VSEGQLKLKSGAAVSTGGDKASGQGAAPDASSQKKKKSP
jgi:hypothetical protein